MRKLGLALGLAVTALVAACGGGGGSSGDTQERYSITLRADKTSLPVNVGRVGVGISARAPYTTTLYVNAKEGNDPIQGGEEVFACNVAGGLNTGALYYLDGDDEHEDDDGNQIAYRNVVLDSNAGGNSFHFHAGDQAGTATITCAVTDPRDNRVYSASTNITVGGGAGTGKAASVYAIAQSSFLGSQVNVNRIPANVGINAVVMDDAVQPIPNPAAANVQIRILPSTASAGARLLLDSQSGNMVRATTRGGVALFSLSSGPSRGAILLELTADRHDNNVTNGIQDPIVQYASIPVVHGVSATPVEFEAVELDAANGTPFAQVLEASGGTPPYEWTHIGSLPSGLDLSPDGIISGTPRATPGTYAVRVGVTDRYDSYAEAPVTIVISGEPIAIETTTVSAMRNVPFSYALSATGGTGSYTWSAEGDLPTGLTLNSNGVITGTPTAAAGTYNVAIGVRDSAGGVVRSNITINIDLGLTISTTNLTVQTGTAFTCTLNALGGASPYAWAVVPPPSLPSGVTLVSDGRLTVAEAVVAAPYSFEVEVTDANNAKLRGSITLTVVPAADPAPSDPACTTP